MRKIISFCVWGKNPIYNYGLYENALLLPKIFPGWILQVYYTKTADLDVIEEMTKMKNVETILIDVPDHFKNTLLRFMAGFDPKNDVVIFRDADSRLLKRDFVAVNDWINNSDKSVHIIRDHPANGSRSRISAGLWGVRNKFLCKPEITNHFDEYFKNPDFKGWSVDEQYLHNHIYPLVLQDSRIHADFNRFETWATKFPANAPSRNGGFIGYTASGTPNASIKFNNPKIKHNKYRVSDNRNLKSEINVFGNLLNRTGLDKITETLKHGALSLNDNLRVLHSYVTNNNQLQYLENELSRFKEKFQATDQVPTNPHLKPVGQTASKPSNIPKPFNQIQNKNVLTPSFSSSKTQEVSQSKMDVISKKIQEELMMSTDKNKMEIWDSLKNNLKEKLTEFNETEEKRKAEEQRLMQTLKKQKESEKKKKEEQLRKKIEQELLRDEKDKEKQRLKLEDEKRRQEIIDKKSSRLNRKEERLTIKEDRLKQKEERFNRREKDIEKFNNHHKITYRVPVNPEEEALNDKELRITMNEQSTGYDEPNINIFESLRRKEKYLEMKLSKINIKTERLKMRDTRLFADEDCQRIFLKTKMAENTSSHVISPNQEQISQPEATQEQNSHEEATQEQNSHEEATQEQNSHEEATQEQNSHEEATQEQNSHEEETQEQISHEEATQEQNSHEEPTHEQISQEEATQEQISQEEATQEFQQDQENHPITQNDSVQLHTQESEDDNFEQDQEESFLPDNEEDLETDNQDQEETDYNSDSYQSEHEQSA